MDYKIINQNNIDYLKTVPDNTYDSIITDPPYLIGFLGKDWDAEHNDLTDTFRECLRVLKPGGYLLSFSAARTYHKVATMIEVAGFEIRDQLMWLYSSGFPKAQDIGKAIQKREGVKETKPYKEGTPRVGGNGTTDAYNMCKEETICTDPEAKQWAGWGTALKPAHEPIVMARKPFKGSTIDNVLEWGTGGLNIDATRIGYEGEKPKPATYKNGISYREHTTELHGGTEDHDTIRTQEYHDQGRYPSNVIGEVEGYSKYFYQPKVSRAERHVGHDMPKPMFGQNKGCYDENGQRYAVELDKRKGNVGNNHPTVKPVALMAYLIKLVTPPNGHVLDPFCGSGSTGMAAKELGFEFTGIELDPDYCKIAEKRIEAWAEKDNKPKTKTKKPKTAKAKPNNTNPDNFDQLFG